MAMGSSAAATAVAALPSKGWSQDMIGDYLDEVRSSRSASAPRRVVIHNLHTDERVDAIYFDEGRYVPDALAAVNHVMRDYRTGDVHFMEPQLLDLNLHRAALAMQRGGVGYYPESDFVHVDVGPVRTWG
jgi:uncharacterized protein YcbK (DUF882 family)